MTKRRKKKYTSNRREEDIETQNAEIRCAWRGIKVAKVFDKSSADSFRVTATAS